MKEAFSSIEPENQIKREEVISAYRKFVEQGVTNPDDLDLEDTEVQTANELFDKWCNQVDLEAGDDHELQLRANLTKTMFYVDAGFTDSVYLDGVLGWLAEEAQNAEKEVDNAQRTETRNQIATVIKKVRGLIETSRDVSTDEKEPTPEELAKELEKYIIEITTENVSNLETTSPKRVYKREASK